MPSGVVAFFGGALALVVVGGLAAGAGVCAMVMVEEHNTMAAANGNSRDMDRIISIYPVSNFTMSRPRPALSLSNAYVLRHSSTHKIQDAYVPIRSSIMRAIGWLPWPARNPPTATGRIA
jgi:hypothetical protein